MKNREEIMKAKGTKICTERMGREECTKRKRWKGMGLVVHGRDGNKMKGWGGEGQKEIHKGEGKGRGGAS